MKSSFDSFPAVSAFKTHISTLIVEAGAPDETKWAYNLSLSSMAKGLLKPFIASIVLDTDISLHNICAGRICLDASAHCEILSA